MLAGLLIVFARFVVYGVNTFLLGVDKFFKGLTGLIASISLLLIFMFYDFLEEGPTSKQMLIKGLLTLKPNIQLMFSGIYSIITSPTTFIIIKIKQEQIEKNEEEDLGEEHWEDNDFFPKNVT